MKKNIPIALFIGICQILFSQVTDINGKIYPTTLIGSQIWMSENLDVDRFQNGDQIREAKTMEEWEKATKKKQPVWCYNDNNPVNGVKYGKLYNWFAVSDPRGLAPEGFHIPSSIEWNTLIETLGGPENCADAIRSTSGWVDDAASLRGKAYDYNGTNESGFNALPAGYRNNNGVHISGGTNYAYWWTSTEDTPINAWFVTFGFFEREFNNGFRLNYEEIQIRRGGYNQMNKDMGYSVRCIKN
jgi:uncharacterized protein (TIGR02145 family)